MMYNYCYQSKSEMGSAIRFYNSQQINTVHCNQMDTCRLGVRFDAGNIGNQGSTGAAQENTWYFPINPVGAYYAFQRDNFSANPLWFVRTNIPSLPYRPANLQMNPTGFVSYSLGNQTTDCEVPCPGCPNQRMADIVTRKGDFVNLSDEEYYNAASQIYTMLEEDNTLMNAGYTSDAILQNFRDSASNTNIGLLNYVNELIQDSLMLNANVINNWVQPINIIEDNKRIVNEIYLSTWGTEQFELDANSIIQLENIAQQNPLNAGDAVYSARVMLGRDEVDFINNLNRNSAPQINSISEASLNLEVKPNPASDFIEIENWYDDKMNIAIINSIGKEVFSSYLKLGINKIDISQFSNGLYKINFKSNLKVVNGKSLLILK